MKALLLALLLGCTPKAMTTTAEHPANPDAPTGRLAGPPAALRPGVADVSTPSRATTPASTTDHSGHGAAPTTPAPDHAGHEQGQPGDAAPLPAPQKPTQKKPTVKPPTEKPRKQDKPPASKKAPEPETPTPPPPPAHQGHEGHQ